MEKASLLPNLSSWLLAMRPKSMMAAIIPVLVGSALAPFELEQIKWGIVGLALLVACFLTIATNLLNDALDFKNGVDTPQRLGPKRVTQSGLIPYKQVMLTGSLFLLLAFLFALPLIARGGIMLLLALLVSMLCSYLYTGGPYPLKYVGLGELFVILFYGLVATVGSYYLQTERISGESILAGLQVGFLATVLIAINNLRDISEDSQAGKKTLAARFGLTFGRIEITLLILAPFALSIYWLLADRVLAFALPSVCLLIGINLIRQIWKHSPSKLYNRFFAESALLLTLFGFLLILALRLG